MPLRPTEIMTLYSKIARNLWTSETMEQAQKIKSYMTRQFILEWSLGVSPTHEQMTAEGLSDEDLISVGLLVEHGNGEGGGFRPHFRDRIIIPHTEGGEVVYLTGRRLSDVDADGKPLPKQYKALSMYAPPNGVDRPDGFNVDVLKDINSLADHGLWIVEGPLDAARCSSLGQPAVAFGGGAPEKNKGLLKRLHEALAYRVSIYVALDGTPDVTPEKRALAAGAIGPLARICILPGGLDPDDLSLKQIAELKEKSQSVYLHWIEGLEEWKKNGIDKQHWAHDNLQQYLIRWRNVSMPNERKLLDIDMHKTLGMEQDEYLEFVGERPSWGAPARLNEVAKEGGTAEPLTALAFDQPPAETEVIPEDFLQDSEPPGIQTTEMLHDESGASPNNEDPQPKKGKKKPPVVLPRGMEHLTDAGNANRLINLYKDDIRYCSDGGYWLVWRSTNWQPDDRRQIMDLARSTAYSINGEAAQIADEETRAAVVAHARRSENCHRLKAMVELASHDPNIVVLANQLDADPMLLNCQNATVNLRTGTLNPHRPENLITKMCNAGYDPKAQCPRFIKFLAEVLGGSQELTNYLQRVVGYAITGLVSEHILAILYGSGRNGKSTLLMIVRHVAGTYARLLPPELLLAKGQNVNEHPTIIASLQGVRVALTVELDDGRRFDEARLKWLTGGDILTARRMRQDFFEFEPHHTFLLATNHRPLVCGTDIGIWRRLRLIPFTVEIAKDKVDRHLLDKLKSEADGILTWIIKGALDYQKNGLCDPQIVTDATDSYRSEMDKLGRWIADCCLERKDGKGRATPLYESYKLWCVSQGERFVGQNKFGRQLTERKFPRDHDELGNYYIGIELTPTTPAEAPDESEGYP